MKEQKEQLEEELFENLENYIYIVECEKMRQLTLKEIVTRSQRFGWYIEDVLYKTDCDYVMSLQEFLEHNGFRDTEESYELYLESMPVVYVKSGV